MVLAAALTLVGCSVSEATPPTLDGTSWRLVSIQSMDDEQGTTTVPDPSRYTMEFGTDGRATFRIDCNQGSGSWEATPSSDDSGSLAFGPIALTMMACPEPTIDQKVSTSMQYVRTYLFRDGQLHLALLADSGILTWEPID